jgi:hypothetical protein
MKKISDVEAANAKETADEVDAEILAEVIAEAKTQTTGYMFSIKDSTIGHYHTYHNAECIVCSALEPEMVRVGAVIFCSKCVKEQFSSENPVRDERETYLKWLNKRNEM